jgi:hypothetical protein
MPDKTLLTLWEEVRGKTLAVLEGVSEADSLWAPAGLHNSIRWHAGHCCTMVEWLCADAAGCAPLALEGWFQLFGWESRPATIRADRWPPLATIVQELTAQRERLRDRFARLSESDLDNVRHASRHQSVRRQIVHAIHDEGCHCGEIWLLRKLLARRAGGGPSK